MFVHSDSGNLSHVNFHYYDWFWNVADTFFFPSAPAPPFFPLSPNRGSFCIHFSSDAFSDGMQHGHSQLPLPDTKFSRKLHMHILRLNIFYAIKKIVCISYQSFYLLIGGNRYFSPFAIERCQGSVCSAEVWELEVSDCWPSIHAVDWTSRYVSPGFWSWKDHTSNRY